MEQVQASIAVIDYVVIAVYLLVVVGIGVWVTQRTKTGEDLFLAGRSLTWGAIGLSLFASNISTSTLIGLSGSAYEGGIAVSAYEWMAGIPLIFMAFVFAPLFLKSRITTTPEYLDLRFSRRVRLYFSALSIIFTILVDCAGGLYAGGLVLQTFFPDLPLWVSCVAIGLFAGIYTAAGGLRAVVLTDILQALVLIIGTGIAAFLMWSQLDYSLASVEQQVPEGHFSMVQPIDDATLPWPGLFTGVWLLGFWYWVTNQYIVQRVLGAKDVKHAQWGAILGGLLKILPLFIMVMPGAMAIALLPDVPNKDQVFPVIITEILPAGLTGLVMAGLIAAIMSSVDSTLNSSSTLLVADFIEGPGREIDQQKQRRYGTYATLGFMVIAIIWSPLIQFAGGLWAYLQQAFSIIVPPLVVLFVGGALWRRGTADAAWWTLIFGHTLGAIIFALGQAGIWPLHFTINVTINTVVSGIFFYAMSMRDAPEDKPEEVFYTSGKAIAPTAEAMPWYADIRLHAAILGAAMLAVLIAFW